MYKVIEVVYALFLALYIGSMGALALLVVMNGLPLTLKDFHDFGKEIGCPSAPLIYYLTLNCMAVALHIFWSWLSAPRS